MRSRRRHPRLGATGGLTEAELAQRRANGQKIRDRYGRDYYANLGRKGGSVTLEERRLRALEQEQRQQAALTNQTNRKGAAQAPIQRGGGKEVDAQPANP